MLHLTRRPYESVVITAPDGTELHLTILNVDGSNVRLGFEAPQSYTIDRYEVSHRKKREAAGTALQGPEPRGPGWLAYRKRREEAEAEYDFHDGATT